VSGSRLRLFTSLLERQRQREPLPDEALQSIVDAVARAMDTQVATLYRLDSSAGELVLVATRGLPRSGIGFVTLNLGEGISGAAAMSGEPVNCSDISEDRAFKLIAGFDQSRYQSILAVPIVLQDSVIGALNVQTEEVHTYSDAEIIDLCAIARTIASMLDRYWNDGDLALRLRGPALLSNIDGILAASLGPKQVCDQLLKTLIAVLPTAQSAVAITISGKRQITPPSLEADSFLRNALEQCLESGLAIELDDRDGAGLALPLAGQSSINGALAVSTLGHQIPWKLPHVRNYLDALAQRVGRALESTTINANTEVLRAQETPDQGASLYGELVELVLQDHGLEEVVSAASRACETAIGVVDVFGCLLAGVALESPEVDLELTAGGQRIGRLLASTRLPDASALETVARVVSLELAKSKVRFEVEGQLRGDVLDRLLSGNELDIRELQARANIAGLDLRLPYTPVMFMFDVASKPELSSAIASRSLMRALQRHLGEPPASLAFSRPDGILVLVANFNPRLETKLQRVGEELQFLTRLPEIATGIGTSASEPIEYPTAVKKAVMAATLGARLGYGRPVTSDRLGVNGLLIAISDSEHLREYVQSQIGSLLASDEKSGGDLTRTLDAYHRSGERLSVAADLLAVHVNTLKYRLARIESLTGRSLRDPIVRFNMYMALYALRLTQPSHPATLSDELPGTKLAQEANVREGIRA
jgi:sugar diacid utilization regulator/putative methionine-R-sulfoxide reductase with GAF domain